LFKVVVEKFLEKRRSESKTQGPLNGQRYQNLTALWYLFTL